MTRLHELLNETEWTHEVDEANDLIRVRALGQACTYEMTLLAWDDSNSALIYTFVPVQVPENMLLKVSEFIVRANYDIAIGSLNLDFVKGDLSFKVTLSTFPESMKSSELDSLMWLGPLYCNQYFPGIMSIIYGNIEAEAAYIACSENVENAADQAITQETLLSD